MHLELDYSDETSDFRKTNFPARHIYERLLPSVVEQFSNIHYHRSSPYSGFGKTTTDKNHGDLHQCWFMSLPSDVSVSIVTHVHDKTSRERMARVSRTLAQLGHLGRSFCL